jgi:hypothetical protein
MRLAAKVDANQAEIIAALRGVGASVTSLHRVGQGVPDLLVSYQEKWYLLECKSPGGKLTPIEARFIQEQQAPVNIVYRPEDALTVIGAF